MHEMEGVETETVPRATVSLLLRYLDPEVPFIWLLRHMPTTYVRWDELRVPLNVNGAYMDGLVRGLNYDIQISTQEFLRIAPALEEHGLELVQSHKPMPNTLDISRLQGSSRHQVLRENGAVLVLGLPHAMETAVVTSYVSGYLSRCSGA